MDVLSLLLCQDLNQCWLNKNRKSFSSKDDHSRCGVGSTILLFCWVRTALKVGAEEGTYALRFLLLVSLESFCKLSFTSRSFAQFNWHFDTPLHSCKLDAETKVLDTEWVLYHEPSCHFFLFVDFKYYMLGQRGTMTKLKKKTFSNWLKLLIRSLEQSKISNLIKFGKTHKGFKRVIIDLNPSDQS